MSGVTPGPATEARNRFTRDTPERWPCHTNVMQNSPCGTCARIMSARCQPLPRFELKVSNATLRPLPSVTRPDFVNLPGLAGRPWKLSVPYRWLKCCGYDQSDLIVNTGATPRQCAMCSSFTPFVPPWFFLIRTQACRAQCEPSGAVQAATSAFSGGPVYGLHAFFSLRQSLTFLDTAPPER